MASQLSFLGVSWKCQPTCSCREGEDGKVGYGLLESLREIFMKPSWSGDGECRQQGEHCSYELWGGEGCEWNSSKKHIFQPKLRKLSDDIHTFPVSSLSSSSLRPWQATKRFLEIFHGTAGSPSFLKPLKGVLSILCWISWCWIQVCWFFLLRSHSRWRASHQKLQGSQQPGLRNFHLELIWREQEGWSMARSYGVYLVDIACCWLARQEWLVWGCSCKTQFDTWRHTIFCLTFGSCNFGQDLACFFYINGICSVDICR